MKTASTKKKITFVDVIIVVLVICIILGCGYYLFSKKIIETKTEGSGFGYTLRFSNIKEEVAEQFDVGDQIVDSTKLIEIGTIDNVTVNPYKEVQEDKTNGEFVTREIPGKYEVLIHVVTDDAVVTKNSVTVNNYELYYGKTAFVRGDNFASQCVVWGLDTKEEIQ